MANLEKIYVVHPNACLKKYSKKIGKLVSRARPKLEFLPGIKELLAIIPEGECGLPASTIAIEKNVKATFSPVQRLMQYSNQKDVIIRISDNYLQVISGKQHNIMRHRTPLLALYEINKILEITHAPDDHLFTIRVEVNGERQAMTFRCEDAERVILALKASKARRDLAKPPGQQQQVLY